MDPIKKKLKYFYEDVGEKYPEEEIIYHTLRGMLRRKFVLAYLKKFSGSLLDVGCNRGMYLDEYQGGKRFGADLSLNVLKKADKHPEKNLIVADAEQLTCFRANSFDNVLCSEVIEHCLNPQAVFNGIAHVLRQGGSALITTPDYKRKRPKWIPLASLPHYGVESPSEEGYFHTAYHPEELAQMAKKAGLSVIEMGTLEREVKYAAKIPALIFITIRALNRILKSKWLEKQNMIFFNKLTLWVYYCCHYSGTEKIVLPFFKNGVRSFVFVRK